jgi:hypothetical protein
MPVRIIFLTVYHEDHCSREIAETTSFFLHESGYLEEAIQQKILDNSSTKRFMWGYSGLPS